MRLGPGFGGLLNLQRLLLWLNRCLFLLASRGFGVDGRSWLLQLFDLIELRALSLLVPASEGLQREVTVVCCLTDLLHRCLLGV